MFSSMQVNRTWILSIFASFLSALSVLIQADTETNPCIVASEKVLRE